MLAYSLENIQEKVFMEEIKNHFKEVRKAVLENHEKNYKDTIFLKQNSRTEHLERVLVELLSLEKVERYLSLADPKTLYEIPEPIIFELGRGMCRLANRRGFKGSDILYAAEDLNRKIFLTYLWEEHQDKGELLKFLRKVHAFEGVDIPSMIEGLGLNKEETNVLSIQEKLEIEQARVLDRKFSFEKEEQSFFNIVNKLGEYITDPEIKTKYLEYSECKISFLNVDPDIEFLNKEIAKFL